MTRQLLRELLHFLGLALVSLAIVIPIRQFVVQPFLVRGDSMKPNFSNFDYLFVERVSYYFHEPKRGEVIVFRFPRNERDYFIKRVVGLPGERLRIAQGKLYVTAKTGKEEIVEESYLSDTPMSPENFELTLGSDEYYVLGDNRGASYDSRRWGPLPKKDIIGRVFLRIWPPNKVQAFWDAELEQLPRF